MGDGGQGGDFYNTSRNTQQVLAKILRIGVEPDGSDDNPEVCDVCGQLGPFDYSIPGDNPFVGQAGFAPEIYAWGVRNPWRFSVDRPTGTIYLGDVGQNSREEVSIISAGADLGWNDMEAFQCFGGGGCDVVGPNGVNSDGQTMPIVEYDRGDGRCTVIGGNVYRGCEVPAWDGVYFYADFCSGQFFGLVWDGTTVTELGIVYDHNELVQGFGTNAYGDVFVTTVQTAGPSIVDGKLYRIAPGA
jgi:glucose/arabinose dehydrogenase